MPVKKAVKAVKSATAVKKAPAKKKTVAAAKPAAAAKSAAVESSNAYIVIDHPVDNEIVSGLHYAIRIGASSEGSVEISFDDGEWMACRPAAGYWWFDWGYFTPGKHKISARMIDANGRVIKKSLPARCEVV